MTREAAYRAILLCAVLALVAFAAACSGGDASDEDFVEDLCKASSTLRTDIQAAITQGSTEADSVRALERLVEPLNDFVDAFAAADPPKDLEDWHDQATTELRAALARFEEQKTLASLGLFSENPVPAPPAQARERLAYVAAGVDACKGVQLFRSN